MYRLMFVCSIDVGIINLAVVCVELHDTTLDILRITYLANVNSTVFEHNSVREGVCALGHMKTTTDRVTHFVQERRDMFDACAHVLIERQPLVGHTDVEQILFFMFRHKAVLVSPNAMHRFFNISKYSYDSRKYKTVMLADQFLPVQDFPEYHCLERKHDVADALCLLLFWIHTQRQTRASTNTISNARHHQKHPLPDTAAARDATTDTQVATDTQGASTDNTPDSTSATMFTSLLQKFVFKGAPRTYK